MGGPSSGESHRRLVSRPLVHFAGVVAGLVAVVVAGLVGGLVGDVVSFAGIVLLVVALVAIVGVGVVAGLGLGLGPWRDPENDSFRGFPGGHDVGGALVGVQPMGCDFDGKVVLFRIGWLDCVVWLDVGLLFVLRTTAARYCR